MFFYPTIDVFLSDDRDFYPNNFRSASTSEASNITDVVSQSTPLHEDLQQNNLRLTAAGTTH